MKAKDLKNSILQMAVEGKLVPQDPMDEPATVLLERIREEKHRLIAEGKAKFPKGGESIIYTASDGSPYEKRVDARGHVLSDKSIADEVPFEELPEGWAWARLGSAFHMQAGKNIKASLLFDEQTKKAPYPCFGGNGIRGFVSKSNTRGDYPIIGRQGALCGNVKRATGEFYATEHAVVVTCFSNTDVAWVCCFLTALNLNQYATATAQPGLAVSKISGVLIPVPPIAEQRRIVERINELMPLVEEYGRLEDAREELDAALPGRLRKSVLQMAVQGKLVSQDLTDEPACKLLKRIRDQRHELVAEKKMKAPKGGESVIFRGSDGRRYEKRVDAKGRESEPVCIEDEIPFEIPEGWEWARLESVTTYIQRGKSPRYSTVKKHPVVAQKCNQWSGFSLEKAKFIDPETVCKYGNERILRDGDLLWNSTGLGTLGRMAIYDSSKNEYGWAVADSHVTVIRTREDWLNYRFAFAYFAGPSVQSVIEDQASGSTKQKELAQETVKNYLIPIPPLAEQCRIVTQLEAVLSQITNQ